MSRFEGPLVRVDGSPIVPPQAPHNCYYPSGWNRPYSHTTVAVVLTNATGEIAAVVKRHPDEPAEGGKFALPGGYVELGQTVAQAAETEVLEETGYTIVPNTLGRFALLDGPLPLPYRENENNLNIVHVYTAHAGEKVGEHDQEVTEVAWFSRENLPPRELIAFGHYAVMGMWFRHLQQPFPQLPIVPSDMASPDEYLPGGWLSPES